MSVKTVMVIFGGVSTEHLISRRSAFNIISGLRKAGKRIITLGITQKGEWLPYSGSDEAILDGSWEKFARKQYLSACASKDNDIPLSPEKWLINLVGEKPDCIYPAVHGINCEDGSLQGLLQLCSIPYVGCNVLASAAGMDKRHSKMIFEQAEIPQCKYMIARRSEIENNIDAVIERIKKQIGFPCFLKPNQGGSSVGTKRVDNVDLIASALAEVADYDNIVLIEEFVKAREIEVAIMGNDDPQTAVIGEVATAEDIDYYDYETKYFSAEGAKILLPAPLNDDQEQRIRDYAVDAYKSLGCSGLSRVDFFLTGEGKIFINEINTLPGFTPISIFPQAFAKSGYTIEELVTRLCELAVEEFKAVQRRELI